MNTRAFLTAIWPASGVYCLACPFTIKDTHKLSYKHKTVDTIDDAMRFISEQRDDHDIFFAIHTLAAHTTWNPTKINPKTGLQGANEVRTHANMKEARAWFFDLDVGESTEAIAKYATREAALSDLARFLFLTDLPDPMVVSSGGGFHVYWRCADAMPSLQWKKTAARLHALALHHGMRHDPARTTDQSSVLRVAGTFNLKHGGRRPVVVIHEGVESPNDPLIAQIENLAGVLDGADSRLLPARGAAPGAPASPPALPANIRRPNYDGPVTTFREAYAVCGNVAQFVASRGAVSEPVWYSSIGLLQFVRHGHNAVHRFSRGDPRYSYAGTEAKLAQFNQKSEGPTRCAKLDKEWGVLSKCATCAFAGQDINPLIAAQRVKQARPAPAPALGPELAEQVDVKFLIEPPKPFTRTLTGIMHTFMRDKVKHDVIISRYDMFPFGDYQRTEQEASFSTWAVQMPLEGQQIVKLANKTIPNLMALSGELANHRVYIDPKNLPIVSDFMSAYIRQLQEHQRAHKQYDHLGWTEKFTKFVLPDKTLHIDGSERPAALSAIAKPSALWVNKGGTLAGQVKALEFYNEDKYLPHQFAILCSLASVLFHITGLGGAVVSLSGDSGGSKSTAIYACASIWGPPRVYAIDGTQDGGTANARNDRVITLANLPVCFDEMTHLSPDEIRRFVMHITQYTEKDTMRPDRTLRVPRSEAKSMIAIVSTNNSLHQLLAQDNNAGIAGTVRVFEIVLPMVDKAFKPQADKFLRDINANFGHIGEEFLKSVIQRMPIVTQATTEQIALYDAKNAMESYERYHSGIMGCVAVAGRIAKRAGLIPFNVKKIMDWVEAELLAHQRGVIKEESAQLDPAAVLANYLEAINGETIKVHHGVNTGLTPWFEPMAQREMKAHMDVEAGVIYCRKDAFRDWCVRHGRNSLRVLEALGRSGVIGQPSLKFTLGKDTPQAKSRSNCFSVLLAKLAGKSVTPVAGSNVVALPAKGLPRQAAGAPALQPNIKT